MRPVVLGLAILFAFSLISCPPKAGAVDPWVTNYGIGTVLHPLQEPQLGPPPDQFNGQPCRYCKEHVYVFAVNGLNPMCSGNFNGLCGFLKKQGFPKTYFGQLYTCQNYINDIREVRRQDAEAKIVLLGFSLGANVVRTMANDLARERIKVDLLIYLVGDYLDNSPASRPENVCRIVNVRAQGLVLTGGDLMFNGADIEGARNVKLDCRHILVPSRKETLELLVDELTNLCRVCCTPAGPPMLLPPPPAVPIEANRPVSNIRRSPDGGE